MRRFTVSLFTLFLALAIMAGETWEFTILHTNDLHGMMKPFTYAGNLAYARLDGGGLARQATAIAQQRKEITHALAVINGGDAFTRGPWHTKFFGEPEIEAFNLIGYEMMCVGNNEFKATDDAPTSQQAFLRLLRHSAFPWLAANLTVGDTGVPVEGVHPFIVRRYGDIRVGYLGLTAPRAKDYAQTKGWTISDPIAAAKTWVPLARKECDILIAVTHIGTDQDKLLAAKVEGIDAIIGADSHTYIPELIKVKNPAGVEVPIAQAGEQGIMLGRVDLNFEKGDTWALKAATGKLIPITKEFADDPTMLDLLNRWLAPKPALVAVPGAA